MTQSTGTWLCRAEDGTHLNLRLNFLAVSLHVEPSYTVIIHSHLLILSCHRRTYSSCVETDRSLRDLTTVYEQSVPFSSLMQDIHTCNAQNISTVSLVARTHCVVTSQCSSHAHLLLQPESSLCFSVPLSNTIDARIVVFLIGWACGACAHVRGLLRYLVRE